MTLPRFSKLHGEHTTDWPLVMAARLFQLFQSRSSIWHYKDDRTEFSHGGTQRSHPLVISRTGERPAWAGLALLGGRNERHKRKIWLPPHGILARALPSAILLSCSKRPPSTFTFTAVPDHMADLKLWSLPSRRRTQQSINIQTAPMLITSQLKTRVAGNQTPDTFDLITRTS